MWPADIDGHWGYRIAQTTKPLRSLCLQNETEWALAREVAGWAGDWGSGQTGHSEGTEGPWFIQEACGGICSNILAERASCYGFITSGVTCDHFSHSFSSSMCFADTRLFDDVYVLQTSIEHFQIWIPNMPRKIFKQSGCSGPTTVRQSMSGLDRTVALKLDCSHLGNLHHKRYIRAALLPVGMECHR